MTAEELAAPATPEEAPWERRLHQGLLRAVGALVASGEDLEGHILVAASPRNIQLLQRVLADSVPLQRGPGHLLLVLEGVSVTVASTGYDVVPEHVLRVGTNFMSGPVEWVFLSDLPEPAHEIYVRLRRDGVSHAEARATALLLERS